MESSEGFSFGRPGEPHLEPYQGFPLLLLSPLWSPMGGPPHLEPYEGIPLLLLSPIQSHMGGSPHFGTL